MIGVGVDYTIHYLWRHQQEVAKGQSTKDAVYKALTTTGRGITFNAFSVMLGFAALLFSTFNPIRFFGFLTSISILTCLYGALVIIPSLILLTRPSFLKKGHIKSKFRRNEKKYPRIGTPAYPGASASSE
jgi:predicted RND superfamily exporter protein